LVVGAVVATKVLVPLGLALFAAAAAGWFADVRRTARHGAGGAPPGRIVSGRSAAGTRPARPPRPARPASLCRGTGSGSGRAGRPGCSAGTPTGPRPPGDRRASRGRSGAPRRGP